MDFAISSRACANSSGSLVFFHSTSWEMIPRSLFRSIAWSFGVGNSSGHDDGSSTIDAKMTARQDARGRRAHQRCNVDGCPCRMFFSRLDSLFMSVSGRSTSMSFLRYFGILFSVVVVMSIGLYMKLRGELYEFLGIFFGLVVVMSIGLYMMWRGICIG